MSTRPRIFESSPVGFGFRPTDEELVDHYLRSKILGMAFHEDIIPQVDIYNMDLWLIPDYCFLLSDIQTSGSEWFFFSPLYKRNTNCNQLQRKTNVGYWKSTGPDRDIKRGATEEVIGTKKTLVFHMGGGRGHEDVNTGWVIHEYRARMAALPANETYALCRLKTKKGSDFPLQTNLNDVLPKLLSNQETWPMNMDVDDSSTGTGLHLSGPPNIMTSGANRSHFANDIASDLRNQLDDMIPEEYALPDRPLSNDFVIELDGYAEEKLIPQRRSAVDSGNLRNGYIDRLSTCPQTPLKGAYGKGGGSSSDTDTQVDQVEAKICDEKGSLNFPETTSAGHEPSSSPVGVGFRPTEEELVYHYLKSKILGTESHEGIIPVIEAYKMDPWFIPVSCFLFSEIQTDGPEYFFFTPLHKKFPNRNQVQRTTTAGYWAKTGPDREIKGEATEEVIGTKKTFVFKMRRGPGHADVNTGWVIHEYSACMDSAPTNKTHVLCRLKTNRVWFSPTNNNLNGMLAKLPPNQETWRMNMDIDDSSTGECSARQTSLV